MFALIAQSEEITNPVVTGTFGGQGGVAPALALTNIIVTVWRTAITLGGLALLIMLVIGAFEWITAGGEKGKIEQARERITQSIIGMLVLVGTVAITGFIGDRLGIPLLKPSFENNVTITPVGGTAPAPCVPGKPCAN
ncbi:hypothetical protein C5B42_01840 [Candidatus Cerribacteria bacterium 'Amazon FNV 2010 28 9']|uniref:Uncharacterized protein n=1 Tax=Candidatus Cerribacteria bacterium 'Amazon FNV 2010 28 9' TaxID=2081795 RepID=A0A317JPG3_9BACT|nr:MAG: hypothetical protein C5B42_01840 [Candidatus Cerribacteria bacterium 'Amazon FNV 2010 28 9']